ncbi:MAG: rRNA maturation RNase YbeY [Pseudomonadota bacterium]
MSLAAEIEDRRWTAVDLIALAERAISATLRHLGLDPDLHEVSLLGCDDARIAELNAEFLGKASPTNVLSWPSAERAGDAPGARPDLPMPEDPDLGDIAIAYETCAREAQTGNISLADHATHLVVHGTLHLLGYDHVHDADAARMERIEVEILATLGVKDPY